MDFNFLCVLPKGNERICLRETTLGQKLMNRLTENGGMISE